MLTIVLFLFFIVAFMIIYAVFPLMYTRVVTVGEKQEQRLSSHMEHLMSRQEAKKMGRIFLFAPFVLAGLFYYVFPEDFRFWGAIIGATGGFILPSFYVQTISRYNRDKFSNQLIDALMIMSSSFRGGLSLVQAMEAVVDEMPDPINKEFGVVLGENKMGVSLEEALYHLYHRMPTMALQQMITAILLARETGGNLPQIFNRIVTNIRENKKIQQNLDTLTIQGKIQGIVMALLPIGFAYVVYTANRRIFDHMLTSQLGKTMLIYAVVSELIGAIMIFKISSFKDF